MANETPQSPQEDEGGDYFKMVGPFDLSGLPLELRQQPVKRTDSLDELRIQCERLRAELAITSTDDIQRAIHLADHIADIEARIEMHPESQTTSE